MTDRINGLFVALDEDIREDDVKPIIDAIMQIKHVVNVQKNVSDVCEWIGYSRIKNGLLEKITKLFNEK